MKGKRYTKNQSNALKGKYVSYKIARELYHLNFNEICQATYIIGPGRPTKHPSFEFKFITNDECYKKGKILGKQWCFTAPTYQDVSDWFRETHQVSIEISYCGIAWPDWTGKLHSVEDGITICNTHLNYYEAYTEAILEAIRLIQNREVKAIIQKHKV